MLTTLMNFSLQQQNKSKNQIWKPWDTNVNVLNKFFNTKAKLQTNLKIYHELKSTIKSLSQNNKNKKNHYICNINMSMK